MLISGTPRDQLDIDDRKGFDNRHLRLSPKGEKHPERISGGKTEDRQQQGQRQAAPVVAVHGLETEQAALQKKPHGKQAEEPSIGQGFFPVFAVLAEKQQQNQNNHSQQRPPLQFVGIKAEENKADVGGDDRPAGATSCLALLTGGKPVAVDKRPFDKGWDRRPEEIGNHQGEDVS